MIWWFDCDISNWFWTFFEGETGSGGVWFGVEIISGEIWSGIEMDLDAGLWVMQEGTISSNSVVVVDGVSVVDSMVLSVGVVILQPEIKQAKMKKHRRPTSNVEWPELLIEPSRCRCWKVVGAFLSIEVVTFMLFFEGFSACSVIAAYLIRTLFDSCLGHLQSRR